MTSTATGLPDRYRPLDVVAPDEQTPTGVIRSWRARDRVLNRDVALRVHTPGGPAAREWIARALTAGGLATPALAMVYDAAEGTGDDGPGGAAYVVNEWIEGTRLSDRLASDGPLPERDARAVVRRLAEGVAEAHRVGLPVGGLTPEHVVLRPGGLVGLLSVPAASGTEKGDIAALGALLELCLTGTRSDGPDAPEEIGSPDLAALVRRARSTDPATGLSNVSTMVAMLADRPRTNPQESVRPDVSPDSGWLRRLRERREAVDAHDAAEDDDHGAEDHDGRPVRPNGRLLPPVPGAPPVPGRPPLPHRPAPLPEDEDGLDWSGTFHGHDDPAEDDAAPRTARRRLAVIGLPLLALALVIAFALWFGNNVLSVAGDVDSTGTSVPRVSSPTASSPAATSPATSPAAPSSPVAGAPARVVGESVFNPFGDGDAENDGDVGLSVDGNPATAWSTVDYRGSAAFGNLKPGVGVVYDLGAAQSVAGVTITTTRPGATVQVRTGSTPSGDLDAFGVAASGTLSGTTQLTFAAPVDTRYVLVWITGLAGGDGQFSADLAEVTITTAG